MRRVLVQRRCITGRATLVVTAPIVQVAAVGGIIGRRHRWDRLEPMTGVFMTCMVMYMSGCKIVGTTITKEHLQMVLRGSLGNATSA